MTGKGTLTAGDSCYIGGLPYACGNRDAVAGITNNGFAITAGRSVNGNILGNTTRILLRQWDDTTGTTSLLISEMSVSGLSMTISGSYLV